MQSVSYILRDKILYGCYYTIISKSLIFGDRTIVFQNIFYNDALDHWIQNYEIISKKENGVFFSYTPLSLFYEYEGKDLILTV